LPPELTPFSRLSFLRLKKLEPGTSVLKST
jgi:hypothetical protein